MASKVDPSAKSDAYQLMAPEWSKANALLSGSEAMREARLAHLPKMAGETDDHYTIRLASTFLFPGFREGINTALAKPLSRPVKLVDGAPQQALDIANNVDRRGTSLSAFARKLMALVAAKGMAHILVSYPAEGSGGVTVAGNTSADQAGRRAHFELVSPENLLAAYNEIDENGNVVLGHCRILEKVKAVDPVTFAEKTTEKVRVYTRGKWVLYAKAESGDWTEDGSGELLPIDIPLVTLTWGDMIGDYHVRPYFADLADKNIEHWQVSSHEKNAGIQSCFAMLVVEGAGVEDVKDVIVGPKQLIAIPGDNGSNPSLKYVEPTGTGIRWAVDKLATIMDEMNRLALKPLMSSQTSGNITATSRAIDETHANCEVQAFALATKAALERAFSIAMAFSGSPGQTVGVDINTEFTPITAADGGDLLLKARATGDLSRQTFWEELRRRAVLSERFNSDEEDTRIATEAANGDGQGTGNGG